MADSNRCKHTYNNTYAQADSKPLTGPEPKTVKIPAVMITDTFASVIVERARLKPASIATRMDLPEKTSSLKRSKIRMFIYRNTHRQDNTRNARQGHSCIKTFT